MRLPVLLVPIAASLALPLGACNRNAETENAMNLEESLAAENIVANDVTAIDAVTGDAANMAADVNYTEEPSAAGNESTNMPTPRTRAPGKPPLETPAPAEPVTNNTTE